MRPDPKEGADSTDDIERTAGHEYLGAPSNGRLADCQRWHASQVFGGRDIDMAGDKVSSPESEEHKVISLLPWDLTVRRATTRRQAGEVLERSDADAAIRALSELEAY